MEVTISYNVPLEAVVDIESGEVVEVRELGDLIELDGSQPFIVVNDDGTSESINMATNYDLYQKALEIAENTDWPPRR